MLRCNIFSAPLDKKKKKKKTYNTAMPKLQAVAKKRAVDVRNVEGIDHILLQLPIGEDGKNTWSSLSTGVDGCGIICLSEATLYMTPEGRILGICHLACANCKFSPVKDEGCQIYYKPEG